MNKDTAKEIWYNIMNHSGYLSEDPSEWCADCGIAWGDFAKFRVFIDVCIEALED